MSIWGIEKQTYGYVFSILMFGASIGAYLMIKENNSSHSFFKVLCLTYIFRNMIIVFNIISQCFIVQNPLDWNRIGLQILPIELWGTLSCYLVLVKRLSKRVLAPVTLFGFILLIGMYPLFFAESDYKNLNNISEYLLLVQTFISVFNIVAAGVYLKYKKMSGSYCLIMFLGYRAIFQSIHFYIQFTEMTYFENIFLLVGTLEGYYLFKCIYWVFIKAPWQNKVFALSDTEYRLNDHANYRNRIVNLSHELKTPINVINSATELLILDFQEDEEMIKAINGMRVHCDGIFRIVRNLIDLHKLEGGYDQLKCIKYNLVDVMDQVTEAYAKEYPHHNVIFNPEQEEIYKCIDRPFFERVLMYFIYSLLRTKQDESEIFIEMIQEQELGLIEIKMSHRNVKDIEQYAFISKRLPKMIDQEKYMASVMTMKLIYYLLEQHQAYISIDKEGEKAVIRIIIEPDREDEKEAMILDRENVDLLREMIRLYFAVE